MIFEQIFTAIILGFVGGITPGPIILLAFSEILRSQKKGLVNGAMYLIFAGLTEFFIGLFLILTTSFLEIPQIILHTISLIGVIILLMLAYQIFQIHKIEYKKTTKKVKVWHIISLMLLNGPLWMFWISVCIPTAFKLGEMISYGEFLFLFIFEISMMIGLAIMLFGFNSFRSVFKNEKIISRVFLILSFLLFFIAVKVLYSEVLFFFPTVKNIF